MKRTNRNLTEEEKALRPRSGRLSRIEHLMTGSPDKYAGMLAQLRVGASMASVSAFIGVNPATFQRWFHTGREAKRGNYRRFFRDCLKAIGECSVLTEAEIRTSAPQFWLTRGPRRLLDDQWADTPQEINVNRRDEVNLTVGNHHDLGEALAELRDAGIDLQTLMTFGDGDTLDADVEDDDPDGDDDGTVLGSVVSSLPPLLEEYVSRDVGIDIGQAPGAVHGGFPPPSGNHAPSPGGFASEGGAPPTQENFSGEEVDDHESAVTDAGVELGIHGSLRDRMRRDW